jgi:hypothetical protein
MEALLLVVEHDVRRCSLASVWCGRSTATSIWSRSREGSAQRRKGLSGNRIAAWCRLSVSMTAMKFAATRP